MMIEDWVVSCVVRADCCDGVPINFSPWGWKYEKAGVLTAELQCVIIGYLEAGNKTILCMRIRLLF